MLRIVPRTAVQDIYEEYSSKWQGPLRVGSGTWSEDPPQILQKKYKGPSILSLSQVRTLRIQCVTWAGKTRFQITSNNTAICLGIVFPNVFRYFSSSINHTIVFVWRTIMLLNRNLKKNKVTTNFCTDGLQIKIVYQ